VNARAKGVEFERKVAAAFARAGFQVRGLEGGGDHLAIGPGGRPLVHVEAKRRERMELASWLQQQGRDCPAGVLRCLVFRQSRRPAYAVIPFEQYLELLAGAA
jgi:hypothetical protein